MKHPRLFHKAVAAVAAAAVCMSLGAAAVSAASPANLTQTQIDFISRVGEMARTDAQQSNILPSLTIAQAILESGWGSSALTVNANALFGIKADSRWDGRVYSSSTKECYDGITFVKETALFRAYSSWQDSINDHSAFLRGSSRYAAVIGETSYKTACTAIHTAGYATDPGYAQKLINLIETYGLTAYDTTAGTADPVGSNTCPLLQLLKTLLQTARKA